MIEFVYVVEYDKITVYQDPYMRRENGVAYMLFPERKRNHERKVTLTEYEVKEVISKLLIDDSIENIACYKSKVRVDENILVTDLIDFGKFDKLNLV